MKHDMIEPIGRCARCGNSLTNGHRCEPVKVEVMSGENFVEELNALILKYLPPEEFHGLKDAYGLKVRLFHAKVNAAHSASIQEDREGVAKRLIEWMKTGQPAVTAFTEGPLRQIAYAVEEAKARAVEEKDRTIGFLKAELEGSDEQKEAAVKEAETRIWEAAAKMIERGEFKSDPPGYEQLAIASALRARAGGKK